VSRRPVRWLTAAGWAAVWLLFGLFNLFLVTGNLRALIILTLVSLPPIWVLTVIGGTAEIRDLLRRRKDAGGGSP
jgi:ABC-type proline/glycine betaine transport system permease subunit